MDTIIAEKRDEKAKAKQLRRLGIIPCCIYGGALEESLSVQINKTEAKKLLRSRREGSKIDIHLDNKHILVQIKDVDSNIINNEIIHINFQALEADVRVNSKAQIILENAEKVVGVLEQVLYEVPYSALPSNMIDTVTLNLEGFKVGNVVTLEDIPVFQSEDIELQVSADSMVLKISDRQSS